jgi:hypothetical protein
MASSRVAKTGAGRRASSRAFSTSASLHSILTPNAATSPTRGPNHPLATRAATAPPNEWPTRVTAPVVSASMTAATSAACAPIP